MADSKKKVCAVVGAGDFIGSAIAKRFAAAGYVVVAGRRQGEKLSSLQAEIASGGGAAGGSGECHAVSLDARREESIEAFFNKVDEVGTLSLCVFNVGGNVYFPFLDTSERVFRKVWEMCCLAGFLTAQQAVPRLLKAGGGSLFFTGATAGAISNIGYAAFASGKFGLRAVAESVAREFGPRNIHVAHLIIDAAVDTAWVRERITQARGAAAVEALEADELVNPEHIAETYFYLHNQPRDAWTFELDLRPFKEKMTRA